jgi:hypothetical protein
MSTSDLFISSASRVIYYFVIVLLVLMKVVYSFIPATFIMIASEYNKLSYYLHNHDSHVL